MTAVCVFLYYQNEKSIKLKQITVWESDVTIRKPCHNITASLYNK